MLSFEESLKIAQRKAKSELNREHKRQVLDLTEQVASEGLSHGDFLKIGREAIKLCADMLLHLKLCGFCLTDYHRPLEDTLPEWRAFFQAEEIAKKRLGLEHTAEIEAALQGSNNVDAQSIH